MMRRMNVGPTDTKKNVLEQLLDQGMVLVALDARIDGVDVPSHLGRDAQLRLNLSYRFGLPMTVDDWGILATLTFAGVPFNCRFPWRSVFLLVSHVSGQPYLFPDDIPPELLSQATAEAGIDAKIITSADSKPAAATRPKLRLVTQKQTADEDDDRDENVGDDADKGAAGSVPDARPHVDVAEKTDDEVEDDAEDHDAKNAALHTGSKKKRARGALRFAKTSQGRDDDSSTKSEPPANEGSTPASPTGPRVAPALKRRSGRGSRSEVAARSTSAADEAATSAPQKVSQPTRVNLSSSPYSSQRNTDEGAPPKLPSDGGDGTEPDGPPPAARPRKGGHLRVVK